MVSPLNSWRRFRRLERQERRLLLCSLALLPGIRLGLRLAGFQRLQTALSRWTPLREGKRGNPEEIAQARTVVRMVTAAAREGLFRASCLEQSLALWWLLRRRGFASELRIGVRKQEGKFEAHAWVELRGIVLNDHEGVSNHYSPFNSGIGPLEARSR